MLAEKKWYIINLKLNAEKKTLDLLNRKKIETYFPLTKIRVTQGRESSPLYQPLFFHRAFVHISETEMYLVKQTEGVVHFLYWLNDYAVISKEDITAIRFFLNIYNNVWHEKSTVLCKKETAIENDSAGFHMDGYRMSNKIEKIFLPTLGCYLLAQTETIKEVLHRAI